MNCGSPEWKGTNYETNNDRMGNGGGGKLRRAGSLLGHDAAQHVLVLLARFLVIRDERLVLPHEVAHDARRERTAHNQRRDEQPTIALRRCLICHL